jgi:hypothetical protein
LRLVMRLATTRTKSQPYTTPNTGRAFAPHFSDYNNYEESEKKMRWEKHTQKYTRMTGNRRGFFALEAWIGTQACKRMEMKTNHELKICFMV